MKVDSKSLEVMYRSFAQLLMQYANIVREGSYVSDILKLETIHLHAIPLVTGGTARFNIINMHEEFGCACYPVGCCIKNEIVTMLFTVFRGKAPRYSIKILLDLNGPRNYILWHSSKLRVSFYRLETYKKSFFPWAISL